MPERPKAIAPAQASESTPPSAAKSDLPDLKKRIWLLRFKEHPNPPAGLRDTKVAEILFEKMNATFSREHGAFLAQSPDEEAAMASQGLDTLGDPKFVAKSLRGSDVSGFLQGEISVLESKVLGDDDEGIVKSKIIQFTLGVDYELYDSLTGRRIAKGSEKTSVSETRSDVLGRQAAIPELDRKLSELSVGLSEKIVRKVTPFSEKLSWSGRVLRIDGGRIYVNAGRRTGINIGDVLRVVEMSKDILDPSTGNLVGAAPGRMKGTVKVIQYFGFDAAIAVLQSGGGIQPDDRVELF